MTQVYLAVLDAVPWTQALVAQKRVFNAWWGYGQGRRGVVNQAGQWALPGGKIDPGEAAVAAAVREFKEETGVDLAADAAAAAQAAPPRVVADYFGPPAHQNHPPPDLDFYLVVLHVTAQRQQAIQVAAAQNVQSYQPPAYQVLPRGGGRGAGRYQPYGRPQPQTVTPPPEPRARHVKDWELSGLALVARAALTGQLGVSAALPTTLSQQDLTRIQNRPAYSQDITWYAEMATALTTNH